VDIDGPLTFDAGFIAPDRFHNLAAAEGLAGVLGQKNKKFVFGGGQVELPVAAPHLVRVRSISRSPAYSWLASALGNSP